MLTKERRRLLLAEVSRTGRVVTSDFAARHAVSEVTIRADLGYLQSIGRVSRTHGGAVAVDSAAPVEEFDSRLTLNSDAKQRIAAAAADYLGDDQTIMLDAGTTTHHLARSITDVAGLTIYTPALLAAQHLMRVDGIEVHLMGGRLVPDLLQTVGTARELGIKDVVADVLFLGAQGVDENGDINEPDVELAATKQRMLRRARLSVLLLDSSKWTKRFKYKVQDLRQIDVICTDATPPGYVLDHLDGQVELRVG